MKRLFTLALAGIAASGLFLGTASETQARTRFFIFFNLPLNGSSLPLNGSSTVSGFNSFYSYPGITLYNPFFSSAYYAPGGGGGITGIIFNPSAFTMPYQNNTYFGQPYMPSGYYANPYNNGYLVNGQYYRR